MKIALCLGTGLVVIAASVHAQPKDQFRILGRSDLSVQGFEAITAIDRLDPTAATGWHSHPGETMGYVTDGQIVIEQDGRAPLQFRAGESFVIPSGVAHNCRNMSDAPAGMFVTYILEKGRAFSRPWRMSARGAVPR